MKVSFALLGLAVLTFSAISFAAPDTQYLICRIQRDSVREGCPKPGCYDINIATTKNSILATAWHYTDKGPLRPITELGTGIQRARGTLTAEGGKAQFDKTMTELEIRDIELYPNPESEEDSYALKGRAFVNSKRWDRYINIRCWVKDEEGFRLWAGLSASDDIRVLTMQKLLHAANGLP